MEEICWSFLVARASIKSPHLCQHALAVPVEVEAFYGSGCLGGIRFGDFSQCEFISLILPSEVVSSKPLLEGPLSHPNRTAFQGNFDSTSLWYVNWVQVSKLAAVPDNNCCGCSYHLLDWRQILCRIVLMLLWLLLVVLLLFFVVIFVFLLLLLWLCTAALAVGFLTVTYVTFAVLFVGLCFPHSRVLFGFNKNLVSIKKKTAN
jgi:hypothetical protein